MNKSGASSKISGLIVGGSGLIGGYLLHYFKTKTPEIDVRAPNSKKLSLRELDDIIGYFKRQKPDFVVNCAITAIRSDALLSYEVNYKGSINLARAALALNIPYIHISSAATLPPGENLTEDDHLPLDASLSNYAKSKLMTELTLKHMHEKYGLNYTLIRMAIVYGAHDHKIQGINRLLFNIVDRAMPFMLTKKKGVLHSYSNASKIPYFIHHILKNREEFNGQNYHFVDPEPVELAKVILTIKKYMNLKTPREIYIPYRVAKTGNDFMNWVIKLFNRIGYKAHVPAEMIFLENFYKTQTLSCDKLKNSSFVDPNPEATIFTELPSLIKYYLARWEHLNLFSSFRSKDFKISHPDQIKTGPEVEQATAFMNSPRKLLDSTHKDGIAPLQEIL
ncbi:MAG: NAD-dependent epimerase/dehydratase family protein [Deltaproteobacteria bacterium]|jgi:nucleoside-diphosphate-sugar epimerase|nr:NAD-dependent epimerase/dehydratase family protein [Deltaproteobacteria bacterium]